MNDSGFRSVVLSQLGESRLSAAIETDIVGDHSHARALDADTKGVLRDIHRRVGTASPTYRQVREHRFRGADYRAVIVEGILT
ncbi:MAG: hypothetical protein ABR915_21475 [Thermoguttaceae bacterium]